MTVLAPNAAATESAATKVSAPVLNVAAFPDRPVACLIRFFHRLVPGRIPYPFLLQPRVFAGVKEDVATVQFAAFHAWIRALLILAHRPLTSVVGNFIHHRAFSAP